LTFGSAQHQQKITVTKHKMNSVVSYSHINNILPLLDTTGNTSKILLFLDDGKIIIISKNKVMDKFLIYIKLNNFQKQLYVNDNQEILKALHYELVNKTVNNIQVF